MAKKTSSLSAASIVKKYDVAMDRAQRIVKGLREGTFASLREAMQATRPGSKAVTPEAPKPTSKETWRKGLEKAQRGQFTRKGARLGAAGIAASAAAKDVGWGSKFRTALRQTLGATAGPAELKSVQEAVNTYVDSVFSPKAAAEVKVKLGVQMPALQEVLRTIGARKTKNAPKLFEMAVLGAAREAGVVPEGDNLSKMGVSRTASLSKATGAKRVAEAAKRVTPSSWLGTPGRSLREVMGTGGTIASLVKGGVGLLAAGKVTEAIGTRAAIPGIRRELREQIQTPEQILRELKAQELLMLREARMQGELMEAAGGALQTFPADRSLVPGAAYYSGGGGMGGGGNPIEAELAAMMGGR